MDGAPVYLSIIALSNNQRTPTPKSRPMSLFEMGYGPELEAKTW